MPHPVLARVVRRVLVVAAVGGLVLLPADAALAHGEAGEGRLELAIGFAEEPAFAGLPNAVQVFVEHGGRPVTDASKDLHVEVSFGDESTPPLPFEPVAGEPGEYRAPFVPSQAGRYTFHITGTIEGDRVDVEMTSGPTTFAVVTDLADESFPAVDAPSNDELATRIGAEAVRAAEGVAAAEAAAASAENAASSARTVGLIGIALGAIGVIAAIAALAAGRRKA